MRSIIDDRISEDEKNPVCTDDRYINEDNAFAAYITEPLLWFGLTSKIPEQLKIEFRYLA